MTRALLAALFLAACARSNAGLIERLEAQSRSEPRPGLDRLLAGDPPVVPRQSGAPSATLPLEKSPMPTVRGTVNGASLPLILDTGATWVMLSGPGAEAARAYLPAGRDVRMLSPGFDARYRMAAFDRLDLGPLGFGPGVAVVPVRETPRSPRAYGIVGCSVLGHFRLRFDFRARTVHLEPHGAPARMEHLFAPVTIHGEVYWLLVDTGATRLFLEPWAACDMGLLSASEAKRHAHKTDTFRSGHKTLLTIGEILLAGRVFRDVRAGVIATFDEETRVGGVRPAGLLGLSGFGALVWTVDFGSGRIGVEG